VVSPVHAFLAFALLHNLTPLGFVAEAMPHRKDAIGLAALAMVGVPLVIATGLPLALVAAAGAHFPDATVLSTGPLTDHLASFVHADWHDTRFAVPVFSAAAYGQCLHYVATLHVLPRLQPGAGFGTIPWPDRKGMTAAIVPIGFVGALAFLVQRFADARSLYGILAAVHVWLEVPALLVALRTATGASGR
jgi:hypothetical protein